jgi:hypothetical protein
VTVDVYWLDRTLHAALLKEATSITRKNFDAQIMGQHDRRTIAKEMRRGEIFFLPTDK